jgi:hypothetical protein
MISDLGAHSQDIITTVVAFASIFLVAMFMLWFWSAVTTDANGHYARAANVAPDFSDYRPPGRATLAERLDDLMTYRGRAAVPMPTRTPGYFIAVTPPPVLDPPSPLAAALPPLAHPAVHTPRLPVVPAAAAPVSPAGAYAYAPPQAISHRHRRPASAPRTPALEYALAVAA